MPSRARTEVDIFDRALARCGEARLELETAKATSGSDATSANPVVVTATAHGYSTGDFVLVRGFTEMTEVNGRVFEIVKVDDNSFQLDQEDGSGYTAETTGGSIQKLPGNVSTKLCFDAWEEVRDEVLRAHSWSSCTKRTRLSRLDSNVVITSGTAANPIVMTTGVHSLSTGDQIKIGVQTTGDGQLDNRYFTVTVLTTTTLSLNGEDGSTYSVTGGGVLNKVLTPLKNDSGYGYRYTLPTDSLRVLDLVESKSLWVTEADKLLTDDGKTVPITYVFLEKDVTNYDKLLFSALGSRLASEIVEPLTGGLRTREFVFGEYQQILGQARQADAREQSSMPGAEDSFIEARLR